MAHHGSCDCFILVLVESPVRKNLVTEIALQPTSREHSVSYELPNCAPGSILRR